eukprot:symbB.v1.2.030352.t1/scaffold3411.1/size57358/9
MVGAVGAHGRKHRRRGSRHAIAAMECFAAVARQRHHERSLVAKGENDLRPAGRGVFDSRCRCGLPAAADAQCREEGSASRPCGGGRYGGVQARCAGADARRYSCSTDGKC